MCHSMNAMPPYGIPIPPEVHNQYSPELKEAWETFNTWWQDPAGFGQSGGNFDSIAKDSMPTNVRAAYDLINKTPIPGYEETGAESCYMVSVNAILTD